MFTDSDKKYIVLNSKRDRKKTFPVLTAEFNMGLTELNLKKLRISTVGRALTDAKMSGRVGARKPLLRKENVAKRLKLLWPDESKF